MIAEQCEIPGDLISGGKAAKMLGVHPSCVLRWAWKGKLRCWTLPSGFKRYSAAEVRSMLKPLPTKLADADAAATQAKRIEEQKERLRRRHGMRV